MLPARRLSSLEQAHGDYSSLERAQLDNVTGLGLDSAANVYFTQMKGRVQKWSPEGKTLAEWPTRGKDPMGVAVDGAGNIYVGQRGWTYIEKYTQAGKRQASWRARPASVWLDSLTDVALDTSGNLLIALWHRHEVYVSRYATDGAFLGTFPTGLTESAAGGNGPIRVAASPDGKIYVTDPATHSLLRFTADGRPLPFRK